MTQLAVAPARAVLGLECLGRLPAGAGRRRPTRRWLSCSSLRHRLFHRLEGHRRQAGSPGHPLRRCPHSHGRPDPPEPRSMRDASRRPASQRELRLHLRQIAPGAGVRTCWCSLASSRKDALIPTFKAGNTDRDHRHRPDGDHLLDDPGHSAQLPGRAQHHVARPRRQRHLLRHAHVPQHRARHRHAHLGPDRHRLGGAGVICRRDGADHPLGRRAGQALLRGDRAHRSRAGRSRHGHRRQPAPDHPLCRHPADRAALPGLHAAALGHQHALGHHRRLCGRRRHRLLCRRDHPQGRLPSSTRRRCGPWPSSSSSWTTSAPTGASAILADQPQAEAEAKRPFYRSLQKLVYDCSWLPVSLSTAGTSREIDLRELLRAGADLPAR